MADTLSKPDEKIFHASPFTLQQLASLKLALQIWIKVYEKNTHIKIKLLRAALDSPEDLSLPTQIPPKIREMIESCFNLIIKGMQFWHRNLRNYLSNILFQQIYRRYNLVAFGGNGTVNLENTLENIFECDFLSDVDKFEIACVFCVQQKIDFLWPRMEYLKTCSDGIRLDRDFMTHYWICLKEDRLDKISARGFDYIPHLMINQCLRNGYFLAIEHFLSSLSPDERFAQITRLCESDPGFQCVKYLLTRFDAPVQRYVLDREYAEILPEFIENYTQIEYAYQCWLYIKDSIKREDYIRIVIMHSIKFRNRFSFEDELFKYTQIELFLTDVWSSTPPHLKEYTLKFHLSDILYELSLSRVHRLADFGRDIGFLQQILSDVDFPLRNTFWKSNWLKWITGVPPNQLKMLMRMCLENSQAVADFVGTLTNSNVFLEYCDKLITLGYYDALNEFLNNLCPNQEQVLYLKKLLLIKSTTIFTKSPESLDMDKHVKYIDETFSNPLLAEDFKERLILSDKVLKHLSDRIDQGYFKDCQVIVSLYLSSRKHKEIIKTEFLKALRNKIMKAKLYDFDEFSWQNFLMWCLNNNQEQFDAFMKSLPIDQIFQKSIFNCLVVEPMYRHSFVKEGCRVVDLYKFLMWYFQSQSVCQKFIRQKVKFYERMSKANVESIFIRDKRLVIAVLKVMLINGEEDDNGEENVGTRCARILRRWRRHIRNLIVGCFEL